MQLVQAEEASASMYLPAAQSVHTEAPVTEYFPVVQLVHVSTLVCDVDSEYVLAVHLVQAEAPVDAM